jgi:hypothetical protein
MSRCLVKFISVQETIPDFETPCYIHNIWRRKKSRNPDGVSATSQQHRRWKKYVCQRFMFQVDIESWTRPVWEWKSFARVLQTSRWSRKRLEQHSRYIQVRTLQQADPVLEIYIACEAELFCFFYRIWNIIICGVNGFPFPLLPISI